MYHFALPLREFMILNLNLNLKLLNKFLIYYILNHLFHYMHCVGGLGSIKGVGRYWHFGIFSWSIVKNEQFCSNLPL